MKKLLPLILMVLCGLPGPARADFAAGRHYQELFQAQPVDTGAKIEVREFFWYGCPHCYSLEPTLEKWLKTKPANVAFVRVPAALRDSWAPQARAYFAFEALGVTDKLHAPLFRAIHEDQHELNSAQSLAEFAAGHGVDKTKFLNAYNSFAVDQQTRRAGQFGQRYELDGVPTIVVDGKYRTSATMAGGGDELMRVVDFLIKKAAAARAKAKPK